MMHAGHSQGAAAGSRGARGARDPRVARLPLLPLLPRPLLQRGASNIAAAPRKGRSDRAAATVTAAAPKASSTAAAVPKTAAGTVPPVQSASILPPTVSARADKHRFVLRGGGVAVVAVDEAGDGEAFEVTISVPAESLPAGTEPLLQWGMFRVPGAAWQHPADVVPPGSTKADGAAASVGAGGGGPAMRSPMARDAARGVFEARLVVKRRMAPVLLAFDLALPELGAVAGPLAGGHCVVPVGMGAGSPEPLGPSLVAVTAGDGPDATCSVNFAVFSRHATAMSLCVMRADGSGGGGYLEVGLDPAVHRTGDVWHAELRGLRGVGGLVYGWRAGGARAWEDGGAFHPAYIMLDPCCPRALPVELPQAAYDAAPLLPPSGRLSAPVLLGSLAHLVEAFDWAGGEAVRLDGGAGSSGEGDDAGAAAAAAAAPASTTTTTTAAVAARRRRSLEASALLELDVAAFTSGADAERLVPPEHRGTYLGVIDRIPDILASGATAVVLANVFLSSVTAAPPPLPGDGGAGSDAEGEGAGNAAGAWPADAGASGALRRPLSFFAPEVAYAAGGDPGAASAQLKALIAALHRAGIEVLLEAEFCLTAEVAGGAGGRLQSVAGLDGDVYVRGGGGPRARGVLNAGQPVVRRLVRAALRHWAAEYRADGFVLVHAENLCQDALGGVRDSPPLLEELAADPVLRGLKLVASGADGALLPRGGERGVPHYGSLAEWNHRFARDALAALRDGRAGHLGALAARLAGSPDLTAARWDAGLPGGLAAGRRPAFAVNALAPPGGPPLLSLAGGDADLERGEVVARSLLLLLAVSQGTPALSGSVLARAGLRRFAAAALQLRRRYQRLLAPPLLDSPRAIAWHDASAAWEPDWSGEAAARGAPAANYLAFSVVDGSGAGSSSVSSPAAAGAVAGAAPATTAAAAPARAGWQQQQAVYVGFNAAPDTAAVTLPPPPPGMQWRRLVDTSRLPPDDAVPRGGELLEREYLLAPWAALMLDAVPRPPLNALSGAARAEAVYARLGGQQ